jgi:4,5-DOPA dioxygenase extradiol
MKNSKSPGAAIFLGHGSPLNALAQNAFTAALGAWSQSHQRPDSILMISAHWMAQGTFVSCQPHPKQVYDFYGFPEELYQVKYPCPGDPRLAEEAVKHLHAFFEAGRKGHPTWNLTEGGCSAAWGIDHGAWSVLKHLYPEADIPVVQMSLDMSKPPEYHYQLGQALRSLRRENLLIIGSGNIVHNLSLISWEDDAPAPRWAREMDEKIKALLLASDHAGLVGYPYAGLHAAQGIPTQDHYLPLLYILGLQSPAEKIKFIYEGMQNASISMRCFELAP